VTEPLSVVDAAVEARRLIGEEMVDAETLLVWVDNTLGAALATVVSGEHLKLIEEASTQRLLEEVERETDKLVLEIEVPEFNVEGAQKAADEWYDGDVLPIVTEEWMRNDVIVVANDIPGEKNLNSDFEIHALAGRIIGARILAGGRETTP
jgi:hypothetical protein